MRESDNKGNEENNSITSGPITKTIFNLALPAALGMAMEFALGSTDYFWVGKLGPAAQDALTTSMVIMWTIFASITIVSVGMTAIVSRYVGAKDFETVRHFIRQGLMLAVGLGVSLSAFGYFVAPYLIAFMGTSDNVTAMAVPYIRIFFISGLFYFMADTVYAIFRASGDTITPTKVGVSVVLLNMGLDPILIFGWGPIPAMGVAGASSASAISIAAGAFVIWRLMLRGRLGYEVSRPIFIKPVRSDMVKIATIGLPMFTQQFVFVAVYWFLIKIVHDFGEEAAAAMGIGNRMESLSYLMCYGFSLAASTMVGQNLGAGKPDRAAKCAWGATGLAIAVTAVISILFFTIPELIASIFTDDPQVLKIAVDYLIILGISQSAMAVEIVIENAFGGAGDTIPPMFIMIPGSMLRIPLAYYLCFNLDMGINGVWWTLTVTCLIKAVIIGLWFKKGNWKRKVV